MIKKLIKNLVISIFIISIFGSVYIYRQTITEKIESIIIKKDKIIINDANTYLKDYNYKNYSLTHDFEPKNKKELINIFYTILNSGWKSFFFYCDKDYKNCTNDVVELTKTTETNSILATINNYVNPYNSYKNLKTTISDNGKIEIEIIHNYDIKMIKEINLKIKEISNSVTNDNMNLKEKIRAIHNYIIRNTTYDSNFVDTGIDNYKSNTAYGALINNYAVCSGYSDAMALFLDYLNVANYKIASEEHVWNYVNLDNEWYHLDLTWNDSFYSNNVSYTYFLISTKKLKEFDTNNSHEYNEELY